MGASDTYIQTLARLSEAKASGQAEAIRAAAQAHAEATRANAGLYGQSIATIGDMVAKYPEQQARIAQIKNQAANTALERQKLQMEMDREQRNQQSQQQAAEFIKNAPRNPDGTYDTAGLSQQLLTGGDPKSAEQILTSLENINKFTLNYNQHQLDQGAEWADTALKDIKPDDPSPWDAVHFHAAAAPIGFISDADRKQLADLEQQGGDPRKLLTEMRSHGSQFKKKNEPIKLGANEKLLDPNTYQSLATNEKLPNPEKVETLDAQGNPVTTFQTPVAGASFPRPAPAAGAGSDFDQYLAQVAKERGISVNDLTAADRLSARKTYGDAGRQVIQISPTMQAEQNNAKTVAQGLKNGTVSPEVLLSSRSTAQGMALQAELEKLGVDGNKLTREWTATKRAIGALNSNSQVRLSEVINKASESLDKVDELNKQWSQNASRWGIKALNRASLTAAQNGAYGKEAASVAQRLDAQIADVTSELAQGIMGGNSPTDHAFELAKKNLSSNWTQEVLDDSIKQARYNLNLAQNARNDFLEKLGVQSTQVQTPAPGASNPAQTAQPAPNGQNTLQKFGATYKWDGTKYVKQ